MRLLVFLAKGFETIEFSAFIDVMGWAKTDFGCDIETVICGLNSKVVGSFNVSVLVDKTIEEVSADDYDALAIPGGFEEFGFYEEAYNEKLLDLIRQFNSQKKWIATVCVGALPVGKSGVLTGRRATTYHLRGAHKQKVLQEFGVTIVNEPIVVDDNIITSYCPQTSYGVALLLLEKLTSFSEMTLVKEAMGF
ncbi:DJ-1/PfpI family protein [Bacteroides stercorirosoris]|jgi:4-methyl-5(b-hydroxyethyl)-thiazole monophosphate biosynthesis|uniref:DJ-1/PfpI family protein n=1 Tax=Bacteroides stercorirosoris TaxID=871324 RepID=UPI003522A4E1